MDTIISTIVVASRSELPREDKARMMKWFEEKISTPFEVAFTPMTGPFFPGGYIQIDGLKKGGRATKLSREATTRFNDLLQRKA